MEKRKSQTKTTSPKSASSNTTPISTTKKSPKSSTEEPTPLELDRFIPWMFTKLQSVQTVVVKKMYQDEYPSRRRYSRVSISSRRSRTDSCTTIVPIQSLPTTVAVTTAENSVPLTISYNRTGKAVEIAVQNYSLPINSELIETISLCLPFHTLLTKLTCKGKGLDYTVIDGIAKMLPLSNLTDLCLDNTFVPQGNYYVLLDQTSTLKCLSLSKCNINDVVCKKIAERLEHTGPASTNLRILCLSSNFITDVGAQALGQSLRSNRHIVYLNLCGNSITSVGAGYLLEPLSEFPLTEDEIREKIRRRRDYFEEKLTAAAMNECLNNLSGDLEVETGKNDKIKNLKIHSSCVSKTNSNSSKEDEKIMVDDYVFGSSNIVYRDGRWYANGNLILCSLNLAYNYLDYTSLSKIVDVLSYQRDKATASRTGLLRIGIDGNNLPIDCEEYSSIGTYLDASCNGTQSFRKKSRVSYSRKSRSSTTNLNAFSNTSVYNPLSPSKTNIQINL